MPTLLFEGNRDWRLGSAFCSEALRHGAHFHPKHNMFLSCAHSAPDIDAALGAAEAGFRAVAGMARACP